jgi:hypothetical protein
MIKLRNHIYQKKVKIINLNVFFENEQNLYLSININWRTLGEKLQIMNKNIMYNNTTNIGNYYVHT